MSVQETYTEEKLLDQTPADSSLPDVPAPQPPLESEGSAGESRAFTLRAILMGLLGGLFIAAYSYFNDYGMKQNLFVGNHLPITIYSGLFVFLLAVNPVLRKFGGSKFFAPVVFAVGLALFGALSVITMSFWPAAIFASVSGLVFLHYLVRRINPFRPFSGGELAILLGMALASASLPTSGLMRNLPQILVMPQHYGKTIPDWANAEPVKYVVEVNPRIFPERDVDGKVYEGYVQGIRKGKELPPLRETSLGTWLSQGLAGIWNHFQEIPFGAWAGPAWTWFPVLIVGFIFIISMCRIVHRQWSEHEQLAYPIAEFANALIKNDAKKTFSDVFYQRQFWIAFGSVLLVHSINGWNVYDNRMIRIPLSWNLTSIFTKLTFLHHAMGWWWLFRGQLFLAVVAFAYFLPEEISLSLGLSLPLFVGLTAGSYAFGHPFTSDEYHFMLCGSYAAMAGVIFYTGRYYYGSVLRCALGLRKLDEIDRGTILACRCFLAATAVLIALLMCMGLDWLLATLCVLVIGVIFLVMARASAETGIPFMQADLKVQGIIMGVLGPAALGPASMYILQLIGTAFMQDNRECLSPFVINSLRVGTRNGVSSAGMSHVMILVLSLGIFAAGAGVLWVIYDQGALADGWMGRAVPESFANTISKDIQKLKRTGKLQESQKVTGLARLSSEVRDTNSGFFNFFFLGVMLVLVNSFLRLRYVWWPLYSVLFLFWNSYALSLFIWSFLLGCLIKICVVKFGGGRVYQNLKPLFIGVIIGDLSGGMLFMVYGTLRYWWTGESPIGYGIFPG